MAYTSLIPVRRLDRAVKYVRDKTKTTKPGSLEEAVDYALNRDKTESVCFETGLSCLCETAFSDMKENVRRWHKTGGVQGYHLVQSFAEGEVTPELAHQIGVELADQLLSGRYQAVVTTHLNTRHIHNHIVWCAVALDNGRKYHSNARSYYTEVRAKSDALCRQYGLSVIETPESERGKRQYAKWQAEANGQPTWRTAIRMDIDEVVSMALTWRQFLTILEQKGYEIRMGRKYPTLRPPGKERFVRFKTLGKAYMPEAIRQRILYPKQPFTPAAVWRGRLHGTHRKARKLTGLRALYYRYLYELGALPRKPQRPSYAVRQDIRSLDKRIRQ
ncbi:relaxase/mobilization nuclease domain-containing protein, partial [Candidatus Allofournierella merdipullorum]|uniref:relaxase/mobilization nuclease domain-containing protein n=1 Tax=Candidatus Allofournierella merdipullorum TaxID=2838595 RepID=UPI00374E8196